MGRGFRHRRERERERRPPTPDEVAAALLEAATSGALAADSLGADSPNELLYVHHQDENDTTNPAPPPPAPPYPDHGNCATLFVNVTADDYPWEIAWRVASPSGAEIPGGGRRGGAEVRICEPGAHEFVISDSASDGICCGYGRGYYSLWLDGVLIHDSDGEYGPGETVAFDVELCEGDECAVDCEVGEWSAWSDCAPAADTEPCDDGGDGGDGDDGGAVSAASRGGGHHGQLPAAHLPRVPALRRGRRQDRRRRWSPRSATLDGLPAERRRLPHLRRRAGRANQGPHRGALRGERPPIRRAYRQAQPGRERDSERRRGASPERRRGAHPRWNDSNFEYDFAIVTLASPSAATPASIDFDDLSVGEPSPTAPSRPRC